MSCFLPGVMVGIIVCLLINLGCYLRGDAERERRKRLDVRGRG